MQLNNLLWHSTLITPAYTHSKMFDKLRLNEHVAINLKSETVYATNEN